MKDGRITKPSEWKEMRPTQHSQWKIVSQIDDLVREWTRLYYLAYQAQCKSNQRTKRVRLEQEYCSAVNGYIDYLRKEMFWDQLTA